MAALDRRRINAPAGGTALPIFDFTSLAEVVKQPTRTRDPDQHRKIFLRTGIVPSASGSAYYEIPPEKSTKHQEILIPASSSLKISCTVHGPRPLPRNAAFSPNLLLTANVKFAPFATRQRRGYVRDASERDLGVHLETALRGVVIGERFPKSAVDLCLTIIEGEDDGPIDSANKGMKGGTSGLGVMTTLAGCITVASAALVDASIDCVDLVTGGVAALMGGIGDREAEQQIVLDPAPSEHIQVLATCCLGYSQSRDEVVELWVKGDVGDKSESLIDSAIQGAKMVRTVLVEAIKEATDAEVRIETDLGTNTAGLANGKMKSSTNDVVMAG